MEVVTKDMKKKQFEYILCVKDKRKHKSEN